MKTLVFSLCCLLALASTSLAQSLEQSAHGSVRGLVSFQGPINTTLDHNQKGTHTTQSNEIELKYFNPNLPTTFVPGGVQSGSAVFLGFGQRFTLPATTGFLDSVIIRLDSISQDSIGVLIMPDTLFPTQIGLMHLINIFDPSTQPFAQGFIPSGLVHGSTDVTMHFAHIKVPQNYYVVLLANLDAANSRLTNFFFLHSDVEPVRARTADNSRTGLLASSQGQTFSIVADSFLVAPNGTEALFSNYYITSFVSLDPASVAAHGSRATTFAYPNPASSSVQLSADISANATVRMYNGVGALVKTVAYGNGKYDVSDLASGVYRIVIDKAGEIVTSNIVVSH